MTILSFKYEEMGIMGQDVVGNQFLAPVFAIENRSPAPQESHPPTWKGPSRFRLPGCFWVFLMTLHCWDDWTDWTDWRRQHLHLPSPGAASHRLRPMSWWALDLPWALGPMLEWSRLWMTRWKACGYASCFGLMMLIQQHRNEAMIFCWLFAFQFTYELLEDEEKNWGYSTNTNMGIPQNWSHQICESISRTGKP